MDILEDIDTENKYWNTVAWFKRLCIIVFLVTLCAAFFIYYKGVLNKKYNNQDTQITDCLIIDSLNLSGIDSSQITYQRPALAMLQLSKIHSLIKENNKLDALQALDSLILQTDVNESDIGAAARIIWMSIALDRDDLDKKKFSAYASYFSQDSEENRLFSGRASILNAIFCIKTNNASKAKEILNVVLYSQNCSGNTKEEAKAILSSIQQQEG
jgi:hypothetical protein